VRSRWSPSITPDRYTDRYTDRVSWCVRVARAVLGVAAEGGGRDGVGLLFGQADSGVGPHTQPKLVVNGATLVLPV
jgi:hypothetical protein